MVLDTNILIAFLDSETTVIETLTRWKQGGIPLILPTVVEAEVLAFSGYTEIQRERVALFLAENFFSISFDRQIAHLAATIRRETRIKFPDAAIAATALFTNTPLVTRNVKDFRHVKKLVVKAL